MTTRLYFGTTLFSRVVRWTAFSCKPTFHSCKPWGRCVRFCVGGGGFESRHRRPSAGSARLMLPTFTASPRRMASPSSTLDQEAENSPQADPEAWPVTHSERAAGGGEEAADGRALNIPWRR